MPLSKILFYTCFTCGQRCKCWSRRPKLTSSVISDVSYINFIYLFILSLCETNVIFTAAKQHKEVHCKQNYGSGLRDGLYKEGLSIPYKLGCISESIGRFLPDVLLYHSYDPLTGFVSGNEETSFGQTHTNFRQVGATLYCIDDKPRNDVISVPLCMDLAGHVSSIARAAKLPVLLQLLDSRFIQYMDYVIQIHTVATNQALKIVPALPCSTSWREKRNIEWTLGQKGKHEEDVFLVPES